MTFLPLKSLADGGAREKPQTADSASQIFVFRAVAAALGAQSQKNIPARIIHSESIHGLNSELSS